MTTNLLLLIIPVIATCVGAFAYSCIAVLLRNLYFFLVALAFGILATISIHNLIEYNHLQEIHSER